MQDLSLHILDIAENATKAGGKTIIIKIIEDKIKDTLNLSIEDDGNGMDKETVDKVMDPFFTTKNSKKIGLGLSLLAQAAQQTGGELKIDSEQGKGTKVTAVFQLRYEADRKHFRNHDSIGFRKSDDAVYSGLQKRRR